MRRKILAVLGIVFFGIGGVALAATLPEPKVFVCKYVGTPGLNETLQTGQNPISVSQNSIKDFQGVGSSFNDAQGRSFVVAFDTGQPEPTCPSPTKNNPPPEKPTTTTNPSSTETIEQVDHSGCVAKC